MKTGPVEPFESAFPEAAAAQNKASAHWEPNGEEWDFVDDASSRVIGHLRRVGGSWMLNYRGDDIAIRPDLEWAKISMEKFHGLEPQAIDAGNNTGERDGAKG